MRFKNETGRKVQVYGTDDHGTRRWHVIQVGGEMNLPQDRGLGLGLTPIGDNTAKIPLVREKATLPKVVSEAKGEFSMPKYDVKKPEPVKPSGDTTSESNFKEKQPAKVEPVLEPEEPVKEQVDWDALARIKGIGKKTLKDIKKVADTKEDLIEALEKNDVPLRDDVVVLLKNFYGVK